MSTCRYGWAAAAATSASAVAADFWAFWWATLTNSTGKDRSRAKKIAAENYTRRQVCSLIQECRTKQGQLLALCLLHHGLRFHLAALEHVLQNERFFSSENEMGPSVFFYIFVRKSKLTFTWGTRTFTSHCPIAYQPLRSLWSKTSKDRVGTYVPSLCATNINQHIITYLSLINIEFWRIFSQIIFENIFVPKIASFIWFDERLRKLDAFGPVLLDAQKKTKITQGSGGSVGYISPSQANKPNSNPATTLVQIKVLNYPRKVNKRTPAPKLTKN